LKDSRWHWLLVVLLPFLWRHRKFLCNLALFIGEKKEQKMNWQQILAFLHTLAPVAEPILMNIEQNQVQPELKKLIDQIPDGNDLKPLLQALDTALDAYAQGEIKKLAS
jgi:hypothetical protein